MKELTSLDLNTEIEFTLLKESASEFHRSGPMTEIHFLRVSVRNLATTNSFSLRRS
jgi:hypothetical protein